jgi:hypothetical protein
VFEGRRDNENQEQQGPSDGNDLQHGLGLRTSLLEEEGHAHVLATAKRYDGTQHRQPKKQQLGEFVGPYQRCFEHVASRHPDQQDEDFRHQDGRDG